GLPVHAVHVEIRGTARNALRMPFKSENFRHVYSINAAIGGAHACSQPLPRAPKATAAPGAGFRQSASCLITTTHFTGDPVVDQLGVALNVLFGRLVIGAL